MKITTIGKGNVGGGLARLWREAGHEVDELGREGGDASGAEAVLLAVPGGAIGDALGSVSGLDAPLIDATNFVQGERPQGFDSLAEYAKSLSGAPVAKAFNTVFARLYDQIPQARARPGCLYCGDDEAREVAERLISDAGYEPLSMGGLEHARALEDFVRVNFALTETVGPTVYRFAAPDQL
jgi:predicted dinucleotide-binding enzyme